MKSDFRQPLDFSTAAGPEPTRALTPAPDSGDLAIRPPPSLQRLAPVEAESTGIGKSAYVIAGVVGLLWTGAVIAYNVGYRDEAQGFGAMDTMVLALMALAPLGLCLFVAYVLGQGAKLAAEARRTKAVAERMLGPAALAAAETGEAVDGVRRQIELASQAADRAKSDLMALRDAVAEQTRGLLDASSEAARSAEALKASLGRERDAMVELSRSLDGQATGVTEAVSRQARMVADASDLAQTQIREAEAALAARAADLAAAAAEAGDAARVAGDDLGRQVLRLENSGANLSEQVRAVEQTLTQQRGALATLGDSLRTEQLAFSGQVEEQRSALAEALSHTRASAGELGELSTQGAEAIRSLLAAAAEQFQDIAATARREQDDLAERLRLALDTLVHTGTTERTALEADTQRAIDAMARTGTTARDAVQAASQRAVEAVAQASAAERESVHADTVRSIESLVQTGGGERQALLADTQRALEVLAQTGADERQTVQSDLERAVQNMTQTGSTEREALRRDTLHALEQLAQTGSAEREALQTQTTQGLESMAQTGSLQRDALQTQIQRALEAMSRTGGTEREQVEAATQTAIEAMARVGSAEREAVQEHSRAALEALAAAAEAARQATEEQAQSARARVDELNETAFVVGQKADQTFEQRLNVARKLIEQSAALVEEAGERSAERLEASSVSGREALSELQRVLADVDTRVEALPAQAQARAEDVRLSVERGISELTAAARRAAEETQALDAAFQERVRRNYEMLSEAVRLMGAMSGGAGGAALAGGIFAPPPVAAPAPAPAPTAAPRAEAAPPPEPQARAPEAPPKPPKAAEPPRAAEPERKKNNRPEPAAEPPASPKPEPETTAAAENAGLRPSLKMTTKATAKPIAPSKSTNPSQPVRTGREEAAGWSWSELLNSIEEGPEDEDALADRMISEIQALGLDPNALLPRARIDEIAAAIQAGDASGAREVVRRLAPAAVQRLSRRVLLDSGLRAQTERYLRRYGEIVRDATDRDREGFMVAALLSSDPGRAYLLLDAGLGELG